MSDSECRYRLCRVAAFLMVATLKSLIRSADGLEFVFTPLG